MKNRHIPNISKKFSLLLMVSLGIGHLGCKSSSKSTPYIVPDASVADVGTDTGSPDWDASSPLIECAEGEEICDGECTDLRTSRDHCGRCGNSCLENEECISGQCTVSCVGGYADCEGVCVNLNTDPHHCGECSKECEPGLVCSNGVCVGVCDQGLTECEGSCVNLQTDAAHCGECFFRCEAGEECIAGACKIVCGDNLTECLGACVNLQNDINHCGECNNSCEEGQVCTGGACMASCQEGLTDCGGSCVNLQTDRRHCGDCHHSCPDGEVCSQSQCVLSCADGLTDCFGSCVDTDTDPANCGECGNVCRSGSVCEAGGCIQDCGSISGRLLYPLCPVTVTGENNTLDFTVSANTTGSTEIQLYEVDHNYNGRIFNVTGSSRDGVFTDVGPFTVPEPCVENLPYQYTVAFRAVDTCNPPNRSIFATCIVTVENCPVVGNLLWAKREGGEGSCTGQDITAVRHGHSVVVGHFEGTATFGEGETNETVFTSAGGQDVFIAKYDRHGSSNLLWAKRVSGAEDIWGRAITALSDSSVVIAGSFWHSATFGEGEPNETSFASRSIYVARYNANGTLRWVRTPSTGGGGSQAITTLSDNSVVVTGSFQGTATFGEGELNKTSFTASGFNDIFIARYTADGALLWARRAGGDDRGRGFGITTLSDDSIVITGDFSGIAAFGEGEPNETVFTAPSDHVDFFIARYNPNGYLLWAKHAGGPDSEWCSGKSLTALSDDSVAVTGSISQTAVFGEGELNETILHSDSNCIFLARYNRDGDLIWAKQTTGDGGDEGTGITTLTDDTIALTGFVGLDITFGVGQPNETEFVFDGSWDVFVAKYNLAGAFLSATLAGSTANSRGFAITSVFGGLGAAESVMVTGYLRGSITLREGQEDEEVISSAGVEDVFIGRFE